MCRRNQLPGVALLAFGIGLLLGTLCSGNFAFIVLGLIALLLGVCLLRKC